MQTGVMLCPRHVETDFCEIAEQWEVVGTQVTVLVVDPAQCELCQFEEDGDEGHS